MKMPELLILFCRSELLVEGTFLQDQSRGHWHSSDTRIHLPCQNIFVAKSENPIMVVERDSFQQSAKSTMVMVSENIFIVLLFSRQ